MWEAEDEKEGVVREAKGLDLPPEPTFCSWCSAAQSRTKPCPLSQLLHRAVIF